MNKTLNNILSGVLKIIIGTVAGFIWICAVSFSSLIPTFLGIEDDLHIFGFILLFITLFSPVVLWFVFNKQARKEFLKDGKDFVEGVWYLVVAIGLLLGIIILVSLFFLTISVLFYWLAGLGITTLLVLILIVLILK